VRLATKEEATMMGQKPKPGDRVEFRDDLPPPDPKNSGKVGLVVNPPADNPADPTEV
jgi:hypothetical protein